MAARRDGGIAGASTLGAEPVSGASSSPVMPGESTLGNSVAIIRRRDGLTGKDRPDGHRQQTDGIPRPPTKNASDETQADIATSSDKVANFGSPAGSNEPRGFASRPRDRFAVSVCNQRPVKGNGNSPTMKREHASMK